MYPGRVNAITVHDIQIFSNAILAILFQNNTQLYSKSETHNQPDFFYSGHMIAMDSMLALDYLTRLPHCRYSRINVTRILR